MRKNSDTIVIAAFLTFVNVALAFNAYGQEKAQEYSAIQEATKIEVCGNAFGVVDQEPTCNGKPWQQALEEATDKSQLSEDRFFLMATAQFNCNGKLGNFALSKNHYFEPDLSDVETEQLELLKRLSEAAKTLECKPATIKGQAVDFDLQVKRIQLDGERIAVR